jgi:hypothetical protein
LIHYPGRGLFDAIKIGISQSWAGEKLPKTNFLNQGMRVRQPMFQPVESEFSCVTD